jgi:hypothetical protein
MVVRFMKMFRVILMTKTSARTSVKNHALLIGRIATARVLFRRFGEILRDGVLSDGRVLHAVAISQVVHSADIE